MDWKKEEQRWVQFARDHEIKLERSGPAVVSYKTFQALDEYSCSLPSGVVVGKMWRRHEGDRWVLGLYGAGPDQDTCRIHWYPLHVRHPSALPVVEPATDKYLAAIDAEERLSS